MLFFIVFCCLTETLFFLQTKFSKLLIPLKHFPWPVYIYFNLATSQLKNSDKFIKDIFNLVLIGEIPLYKRIFFLFIRDWVDEKKRKECNKIFKLSQVILTTLPHKLSSNKMIIFLITKLCTV